METDLKFGLEYNPTKSKIDFNEKFESITGKIIINSRNNPEEMDLNGEEGNHQKEKPRVDESGSKGDFSLSQSECASNKSGQKGNFSVKIVREPENDESSGKLVQKLVQSVQNNFQRFPVEAAEVGSKKQF